MAKKALIHFVSEGVTYEAGKIYSDEAVANLDETNFETVEDSALEAQASAEVAAPAADADAAVDSETGEKKDSSPATPSDDATVDAAADTTAPAAPADDAVLE